MLPLWPSDTILPRVFFGLSHIQLICAYAGLSSPLPCKPQGSRQDGFCTSPWWEPSMFVACDRSFLEVRQAAIGRAQCLACWGMRRHFRTFQHNWKTRVSTAQSWNEHSTEPRREEWLQVTAPTSMLSSSWASRHLPSRPWSIQTPWSSSEK